ncbi:hypothetical protein BC629DRAFT_1593531 [Irpex lacteus]|nr:hypothetical protein BC629DRAFT_1593531 [Irpex lacteus]
MTRDNVHDIRATVSLRNLMALANPVQATRDNDAKGTVQANDRHGIVAVGGGRRVTEALDELLA